MNLTQLSAIFVSSGVNKVDERTFTALYHGYNLRGKIIAPTVPTVDFIFYGDIDPDIQTACDEFVPTLFEKYGRFPIKVGNNFFSALLDLSVRDVAGVKAVLDEITMFMMANNCGALGTLPPEPVEIPAPQPTAQPQRASRRQPAPAPQSKQPPRPAPKPPEPEITVPFADHTVLERVLKIFILGINKISENSFTTLFHGYNIVGKMPKADKEILDITFYGESFGDINPALEEFAKQMNEKYGEMKLRNVSGSVGIVIDVSGRADSDVKAILGEVSGFMMKNNIVAINLPNTVPKGVPYDADTAAKMQRTSPSTQTETQQRTPYAASTRESDGDNNNFVGKFLKKFGKKP